MNKTDDEAAAIENQFLNMTNHIATTAHRGEPQLVFASGFGGKRQKAYVVTDFKPDSSTTPTVAQDHDANPHSAK